MPLEQFKNNDLLVLGKYSPDYVIPLSYIESNEVELENIFFMFYTVINNDNYFNARFYHSASIEETLNSYEILNKDFCGFSSHKVVIFNASNKNSINVITEIKASPFYKNHYSECT